MLIVWNLHSNHNDIRMQLKFLGSAQKCDKLKPQRLRSQSCVHKTGIARESCSDFNRSRPRLQFLGQTQLRCGCLTPGPTNILLPPKTFRDAYTKRSNFEASSDLDLWPRVMKYSLYVNRAWDASFLQILGKSAQWSRRSSRTYRQTYRGATGIRV